MLNGEAQADGREPCSLLELSHPINIQQLQFEHEQKQTNKHLLINKTINRM